MILLFLLIFGTEPAFARPEFALKTKQNCTACHVNPWGGGPKTVYGKIFGSRDFKPVESSFLETYNADVRAVAFYPDKPSKTSNGLALMEVAPSATVPLTKSDSDSDLRAVATYNFSPLQSSAREVYVRWQPKAQQDGLLSNVVVGRFNAPFGLLTDEHRTYTRLQTNMTLNNYEMGAAFSGNVLDSLHYDLALSNDFQNGGGAFTNNDISYGEILNVRWNPSSLPFLLGASQNFQHSLLFPEPYAFSAYGALSLDRMTNNFFHATVLGEAVLAKNWNNPTVNPGLGPFFIPSTDTAYSSAITQSHSLGYYGLFRYDFTQRWALIYKFDDLVLDTAFGADNFIRHGLGFETFLAANLILNMRVEKAISGRPEITENSALASESDLIAMLRLWL